MKMVRLSVVFPILVSLTTAIDFDWTYQGQRYWATEIARYPKNDSFNAQLDETGISYVGAGFTGWQQFNRSLEGLSLPAGAYIALEVGSSILIAKAYNIKSDPTIAFMNGSIPSTDGSFEPFTDGVPIPPPVGEGPLGGLNFAVKDIFHVKGLKTSGGSRSYYNAYGPQNYTTEVVRKSLAGGAHLLGKTKTIAFALGAPIDGWEIDYQDPWNVRGDGYQTTGGSSSGSGAAVTAYDWIDFAIGSDTGGSVRFPSRYGGLYGYKPTHGIYNLTGILPAIVEQDTPGFMTRSPSIFRTVYQVWAKGTPLEMKPVKLPSKFQFWSDEAPLTQGAAEDMKTAFFADITKVLNMTTFSNNLTAMYASDHPNQNFTEHYLTVYADQNSVQFYDDIGRDLIKTFGAKNGGEFPPSDPVVNLTFADGANATTRARYPASQRRRQEYADWFNTYILPNSSSPASTCTSSIVAHSLHVPPSTAKVAQTPYSLVRGFFNGFQASFAGTPEVVVPIGQVQYWSPFTRKMEWQPVTVAFMAAKGCDGTLMELVRALEEKGLVKEVLPGKVAYPVNGE